MKSSLENERRALLEQIEASRAVYRRLLAGESLSGSTPSALHATHSPARLSRRDRVMQWAFAHPLQVATAVALLVLLAPRIVGRTRAATRRREVRQQESIAPSGGTLRALLTVAALLLRDPARLRTATTVATNTWCWLLRRRHPAEPAVTTTPVTSPAHADTRLH